MSGESRNNGPTDPDWTYPVLSSSSRFEKETMYRRCFDWIVLGFVITAALTFILFANGKFKEVSATLPASFLLSGTTHSNESKVSYGDFVSPHSDPSLRFCTTNPLVNKFNLSYLMELEMGEYLKFHQTYYERLQNASEKVGKGLSTSIKSTAFSTPTFETITACGFETKNVQLMSTLAYPIDYPVPCKLEYWGDSDAKGDTGKQLCDLKGVSDHSESNGKPCIVYSIGSNNQFDFESSVSKRTSCEMHTFDCTSDPPKPPINRLTFNKICFGPENTEIDGRVYRTMETIMSDRKHTHLDLLKMDIEGWEHSVLSQIITRSKVSNAYSKMLPHQISLETHYWHTSSLMSFLHLGLFRQLWHAGYRFVSQENNEQCPSCNEWTAVRVFC